MKITISSLLLCLVFLAGSRESGHATDLIGGEAPVLLPPEEAIKHFKLHPDYQINLYASEVDFPLHSPAAMTFDSQGRLWVGNIPTQPHAKPGVPLKDSIVVLEDTDKDGVADQHQVFYEGLYLPLGLAVTDGGKTVYATDEPNLVRLRDTDGDGKADEKEILLQGFGTEDNHHFISAFQWSPGGRLYYGQGLFLNSQVETPKGTIRAHEAAVFRHDPRDNDLEVYASFGWSNVWGIIFDNWGQPLLADASPALNYFISQTASNFTYPNTNKYNGRLITKDKLSFTPSGRRPSCGNELLLSDHFPPEVRGWYVTNQMKGWHGVRWYKLEESGSGVASSQPFGEENELVSCSDIMFRPVAMQIGPDGALYVLDFYNPIVGHTTYSFRDPRHIKTHGRVWRITHKTRPLDWQPKIFGEPIPALLANLNHTNYRARYFSRHELHQRPASEVLPLAREWAGASGLDEEEAAHRALELLWLCQNFNVYDLEVLKESLNSPDHRARAAALRVLRYWQKEIEQEEALTLLKTGIQDESQLVRLEALINLSYFSDPGQALPVASLILEKEMDDGLTHAAYDVFTYLTSQVDQSITAVDHFLVPFLSDESLLAQESDEVVSREILNRASLGIDEHRKALRALAGDSDPLAHLLELLKESATKSSDPSANALESILLLWSPTEVAKHTDTVAALASGGGRASVRTCAQAIMLRAAESSLPESFLQNDSLLASSVARAGRGKSPENLYPRFVELLTKDSVSPGMVRTLMPAIASYPSKDRESLDLFAATADKYAEKDISLAFSALEAMKRIPKSSWPEEYSNRVLSRVTVSATTDLKFTPEEFTVKAGSAVHLTFRNPDNLYHNLVIVKAGALESVGLKADLMAGQPDGMDKDYVPEDPNVLHWTPQITLGIARSHVLQFFAPDEPGDYPYVCTFPGHWRVMRGVMKVVE